jgi:formylglycine-generating enzyme required for sulfatase activity
MKTYIFFVCSLTCTLTIFAQKTKHFESTPRDMVFVPQGSFEMKTDSFSKNISLDAFWMSNEITNKEYRKFTDYVVNHPNDTLFWMEFNNTVTPANMQEFKKSCTYRELYPGLIDSMALARNYPVNSELYNKYKNYFTDKAFDKYPVIGVSQTNAKFYCIWKTNIENKELREKGLPAVQQYRLPLEVEWCYAASFPNDESLTTQNFIQTTQNGQPNKLGLFNLKGNVSEWIASSENQMKIAKGSSWKDKTNTDQRLLLNPNEKSSYIGFRIVRSYMGK